MGDAFVPMIFVFAFENNGMVCDVSRRYCSKWTVHYLEVPDPDWLKATIDKLNRSIQFTDDELVRYECNLTFLKIITPPHHRRG